MYLSRLLLNPRTRQVQREIGDPYQLHRTVLSAFPPEMPDAERVLHRMDIDQRTGQITLLVQSQTAPTWDHLAATDYLLPLDPFGALENPAVKRLSLNFRPEQKLRFRLRANPEKRLFKDMPEFGFKKGQRIGLFKEEDQQAWLRQRGANDGGFSVVHAAIRSEGVQNGRTKEHQAKKQQGFTHFAVCYDGILTVTDPDLFAQTLNKGIGRGKAFGFGLLSVAPAQ